MTETEGVIQYRLDHRVGDLPSEIDYNPLLAWFIACRRHELIGRDPNRYGGYAYGNISIRAARGFIISATQTGGKPQLSLDDLAWVQTFDAQQNRLTSQGPAQPSSEAMTHGEIYAELPNVNAVIHVHSPLLWRNAQRLRLPTTDPAAGYGTPAMASEVKRLLALSPEAGVLAMAGHEDGIIAYASDMDDAGERLLTTLQTIERQNP